MAYYVVFNTVTGELVSWGNEVASPLPAGLTALQVTGVAEAPPAGKRWNRLTRAFDIDETVPTPLETFQSMVTTNPDYIAMTAESKRIVRVLLRAFNRVITE